VVWYTGSGACVEAGNRNDRAPSALSVLHHNLSHRLCPVGATGDSARLDVFMDTAEGWHMLAAAPPIR
jgi:hypothetical protein